MPQCGCFHSYELTQSAGEEYELKFPSGELATLKEAIEHSRLVVGISEEQPSFFTSTSTRFILQGLRERETLCRLLDVLQGKVIIDLSPSLDECYALGPYTLFKDGNPTQSTWGTLVNQAKYWRNSSAEAAILAMIEDFVSQHLVLRTADSVISAPKSDYATPDLAGNWAQWIASKKGLVRLIARKNTTTIGSQKTLDGNESEGDLIARMINTVDVDGVKCGSRVLIVDDTIRSGGTLIEIARALREAGASEIYGIAAAKDAKLTQGGYGFLDKERWE